MALVYLSAAWLIGVFVGSKFPIPLALVPVGLVPLSLLFIARRFRKTIILASLCLLAFLGGAVILARSLPAINNNSLALYNEAGTVEFSGLVDRDPEIGPNSLHLEISARDVIKNGAQTEVNGRVLVYLPRYPSYRYGDVLPLRGQLETPKQLDGFDYQGYLARQDIHSTMTFPSVELISSGKGFLPLKWVYSLRSSMSQSLARALPEPQASLAQGIVLGIRSNIPDSIEQGFVRTGTAHMLAVSGMNLSILAGILLSLGAWLLGKRGYVHVWLALAGVWLFALLTGMQPPVVRAAIMASSFLVATLLGRQRSAVTALAFAAAVMVALDQQVLWEASFQLSFLSMAGLVFVFPLLQLAGRKVITRILGENGAFVPAAKFVVDSFGVSLAAIIAVWPVVAYYFGIISWTGLPASFLMLPVFPGVIISGAAVGALGLILFPVAQVLAWGTWLLLSHMLVIVRIFDAVPPTAVSSFAGGLLLVYYAALSALVWTANNWERMVSHMPRVKHAHSRLFSRVMLPGLLVLAALAALAAFNMPDSRLHVDYLDVGQGDAILIQKGSQQVLIDGGPDAKAIDIELGEKMPFWDRTVDVIILTHPHADHLAGLVEVLKNYQVKQIVYPELTSNTALYQEWLEALKQEGATNTVAAAGQHITLGDVNIEVLSPVSPVSDSSESDIDADGLVLRLSMGEVSFLFTGDTTESTELALISRRADLASTVLKVAHHGSSTSTSAEFLAVVNPTEAVISVGADNSFGHPTREVLERLQQKVGAQNIHRTDQQGTIEFITDGKQLWLKTER